MNSTRSQATLNWFTHIVAVICRKVDVDERDALIEKAGNIVIKVRSHASSIQLVFLTLLFWSVGSDR